MMNMTSFAKTAKLPPVESLVDEYVEEKKLEAEDARRDEEEIEAMYAAEDDDFDYDFDRDWDEDYQEPDYFEDVYYCDYYEDYY